MTRPPQWPLIGRKGKGKAGGLPSERDGDPGTDSSRERPSGLLPGARLLRSVVDHDLRIHLRIGTHAEDTLHLLLDFGHQHRIVLQIHLRVFSALSNPLRAVAIHRTSLVDDPRLGSDIEHQARMADPLGVHDIELSLLERRGNLVLHDLHAYVRPDDVLLLLHRTNAANVETHRRIELERLST